MVFQFRPPIKLSFHSAISIFTGHFNARFWPFPDRNWIAIVTRWDEKAGLRRDAVRSQVIDALEAQEIKETGNEED